MANTSSKEVATKIASNEDSTPISSSEIDPQPPDKFDRFCELPIEIRFKIWLLVADEPEPVVVCCPTLPGSNPKDPKQCDGCMQGLTDRLRAVRRWTMPLMLQVCRETRHEFITRIDQRPTHPTYHLCQGIARNKYRREAKLYANLDIDIVWSQSTKLYRGLIISNLRHLALDGRNLSDHGPKFSRFENLLTITVIFDDSEVDKNYGPWRTMEVSLYQSIRQKYGKFSWTCPLFVLRHATDFIFDPFGVPKLYEEMRSRGLFARQSRFCYSTIPGHQELEDYLEEVTKDYA